MTPAELVDALDATWASTSAVLARIATDDWDRPTGCPGWSVKDQLSHLVWAADIWRGVAPEPVELPALDHVHGPMAEYMELAVHARRPVRGPDVLAEFDMARGLAIGDLRSRLPDGLDEPFAGPMGYQMPRSAFLGISVFDEWTHGHDVRIALGVETDRDSAAAAHSLAQVIGGWTAKAADFPAVAVSIDGEVREVGVGAPVATVHWSFPDLITAATGRDRPVAAPSVEGDRVVAEAALACLPLTP